MRPARKSLALAVSCILLGHSLPALAGKEGHGGNVIACYSNSEDLKRRMHPISVEVFDTWQWRQTEKTSLDLGSSHLSVDEKVEYVIQKIEAFEPLRAAELRVLYKDLKVRMKVVPEAEIPDAKDVTPIVQPSDPLCARQPLVFQRLNPSALESKFLYHEGLWKVLSQSNDQAAAMHLHEIVYQSEIARGVENSNGVVRYVGLITSSTIGQINRVQYLEFMCRYMPSHIEMGGGWVLNARCTDNEVLGDTLKNQLRPLYMQGTFVGEAACSTLRYSHDEELLDCHLGSGRFNYRNADVSFGKPGMDPLNFDKRQDGTLYLNAEHFHATYPHHFSVKGKANWRRYSLGTSPFVFAPARDFSSLQGMALDTLSFSAGEKIKFIYSRGGEELFTRVAKVVYDQNLRPRELYFDATEGESYDQPQTVRVYDANGAVRQELTLIPKPYYRKKPRQWAKVVISADGRLEKLLLVKY